MECSISSWSALPTYCVTHAKVKIYFQSEILEFQGHIGMILNGFERCFLLPFKN